MEKRHLSNERVMPINTLLITMEQVEMNLYLQFAVITIGLIKVKSTIGITLFINPSA